jgi:hypothetical protein
MNPPKDGGDLTISGNLKSFEGPVLNCRDSKKRRALDLNELCSSIFPKIFLSSVVSEDKKCQTKTMMSIKSE